MNLDNQKANSDGTRAAEENSSDRPVANERKETRFGFAETDYVVYPAHGVGRILSIEEQAVAGASLEFFVINFAKSQMTVSVPTQKAASVGLRKPSDSATIQRVKLLLSQVPRKSRGSWSRLAQECQSKINSGDIVAVAEVVRDLCRPGVYSGQSFSERQLYVSALNRLSGEVALVDGISDEQAGREIENLVKGGALKRSA